MKSTPIQLPRVLLWGGKSQAHIADAMLRESGVGETTLIFDFMLTEPAFLSSAAFTNKVSELKAWLCKVTHFVACIGGEHGYARYKTARYLEDMGLYSVSLIHEKSFVESSASIGKACQIMPFAVVHKFSKVGSDVILNTNSTVDHDCEIGAGVHIMGGAAIAGEVSIGDFATIGTNATILPGRKIGEGAYVGAGAVVCEDVEPYSVVVGVPAKHLRKNVLKFNEDILISLAGRRYEI